MLIGQVEFGEHRVESEVEDVVLGGHVPIEAGRMGTEPLREAAHAQFLHAVAVQQLNSGGDDPLV